MDKFKLRHIDENTSLIDWLPEIDQEEFWALLDMEWEARNN